MVAPGILARVAARSAAASAGMPAADIATGTAGGDAALGATGVAGGVAAGAAAGAGLFGATTVAAGNLFAARAVAAPLAAGAPRKARPAMELPTKLANAIPVYGLSWLVWLFRMTIGTAVLGNAAATWRIAGGVAQDGGTESPPIELARPVNADTAAPLPELDMSPAVTRLGFATAPTSTDGLVSPRCWSVSPTAPWPKMVSEVARDASEIRLRLTRTPSPIEPNISNGVTAGGSAAAAAWATVAAWPASPAGLVVCGGEVNGLNVDAAAEELA